MAIFRPTMGSGGCNFFGLCEINILNNKDRS